MSQEKRTRGSKIIITIIVGALPLLYLPELLDGTVNAVQIVIYAFVVLLAMGALYKVWKS